MYANDILHGMVEEYESEHAVLGTVRSNAFCYTTATMRTGKIAMKYIGDPNTSLWNIPGFWEISLVYTHANWHVAFVANNLTSTSRRRIRR